jgi:hypothetical protein
MDAIPCAGDGAMRWGFVMLSSCMLTAERPPSTAEDEPEQRPLAANTMKRSQSAAQTNNVMAALALQAAERARARDPK